MKNYFKRFFANIIITITMLFMKKLKKCKCCNIEFTPIKQAQPRCKECTFEKVKEKYSQYKPPPAKRNLEQERVNKIVRERDFKKPCISCGKITKLEAGHFIAISKSKKLRYDLRNIHGQCGHCNRFLYGNYKEFRKGLIARYGISFVELLEKNK